MLLLTIKPLFVFVVSIFLPLVMHDGGVPPETVVLPQGAEINSVTLYEDGSMAVVFDNGTHVGMCIDARLGCTQDEGDAPFTRVGDVINFSVNGHMYSICVSTRAAC